MQNASNTETSQQYQADYEPYDIGHYHSNSYTGSLVETIRRHVPRLADTDSRVELDDINQSIFLADAHGLVGNCIHAWDEYNHCLVRAICTENASDACVIQLMFRCIGFCCPSTSENYWQFIEILTVTLDWLRYTPSAQMSAALHQSVVYIFHRMLVIYDLQEQGLNEWDSAYGGRTNVISECPEVTSIILELIGSYSAFQMIFPGSDIQGSPAVLTLRVDIASIRLLLQRTISEWIKHMETTEQELSGISMPYFGNLRTVMFVGLLRNLGSLPADVGVRDKVFLLMSPDFENVSRMHILESSMILVAVLTPVSLMSTKFQPSLTDLTVAVVARYDELQSQDDITLEIQVKAMLKNILRHRDPGRQPSEQERSTTEATITSNASVLFERLRQEQTPQIPVEELLIANRQRSAQFTSINLPFDPSGANVTGRHHVRDDEQNVSWSGQVAVKLDALPFGRGAFLTMAPSLCPANSNDFAAFRNLKHECAVLTHGLMSPASHSSLSRAESDKSSSCKAPSTSSFLNLITTSDRIFVDSSNSRLMSEPVKDQHFTTIDEHLRSQYSRGSHPMGLEHDAADLDPEIDTHYVLTAVNQAADTIDALGLDFAIAARSEDTQWTCHNSRTKAFNQISSHRRPDINFNPEVVHYIRDVLGTIYTEWRFGTFNSCDNASPDPPLDQEPPSLHMGSRQPLEPGTAACIDALHRLCNSIDTVWPPTELFQSPLAIGEQFE